MTIKHCEVCGVANERVWGKSGKFKMNLCKKHYVQMQVKGKIMDKTRADENDFIVNGNTVLIVLRNIKAKKIGEAIVDIENIEIVKQYMWSLDIKSGYVRGVSISNNSGKTLRLHSIIMNPPKGMVVDHIDHNKLDNRIDNLRICSYAQNSCNQSLRKNNTSGHKGVHWCKQKNKWVAQIMSNGKKKHLGYFSSIDNAVSARKEANLRYQGEFRYQEVSA